MCSKTVFSNNHTPQLHYLHNRSNSIHSQCTISYHMKHNYNYTCLSRDADTFCLVVAHKLSTKQLCYWLYNSFIVAVSPPPPKITIPVRPPLDVGMQLECFVSYAYSPNEFCIQLVRSDHLLTPHYGYLTSLIHV